MAGDARESLVLRNEGSRGGWDEDDGCPKSSTCVFDGTEGTISEEGSGKREAFACELMIVAVERESVRQARGCEAEYADGQSSSGYVRSGHAVGMSNNVEEARFRGLGMLKTRMVNKNQG